MFIASLFSDSEDLMISQKEIDNNQQKVRHTSS